jgi:hypothetical protein
MITSIPRFQSALNFFMNGVLIRYGCSQTFKLFHSFKRFITCLYVPILSCVLISRHHHIFSTEVHSQWKWRELTIEMRMTSEWVLDVERLMVIATNFRYWEPRGINRIMQAVLWQVHRLLQSDFSRQQTVPCSATSFDFRRFLFPLMSFSRCLRLLLRLPSRLLFYFSSITCLIDSSYSRRDKSNFSCFCCV